MGEPLYSKEQWSDDLFVRDTAAETAAGERFVDFMLNTHGRTRGAKPPPTTQYEPLRRTFVSDPNLNNGLKTAEVESHWSLEAENARHWAIAEGGTFGRSKRFPKGDTLIDQRNECVYCDVKERFAPRLWESGVAFWSSPVLAARRPRVFFVSFRAFGANFFAA